MLLMKFENAINNFNSLQIHKFLYLCSNKLQINLNSQIRASTVESSFTATTGRDTMIYDKREFPELSCELCTKLHCSLFQCMWDDQSKELKPGYTTPISYRLRYSHNCLSTYYERVPRGKGWLRSDSKNILELSKSSAKNGTPPS